MLYRKLGPRGVQLEDGNGDFTYENSEVSAHRAALRHPAPAPASFLLLPCGKEGRDDVLLRLSGRDLDRIDGFARLRARAIDDEPLAGSEDTDVVPTEQAVGADAVAPRNSVERFAALPRQHRQPAPLEPRRCPHYRPEAHHLSRAREGAQTRQSGQDLGRSAEAKRRRVPPSRRAAIGSLQARGPGAVGPPGARSPRCFHM